MLSCVFEDIVSFEWFWMDVTPGCDAELGREPFVPMYLQGCIISVVVAMCYVVQFVHICMQWSVAGGTVT